MEGLVPPAGCIIDVMLEEMIGRCLWGAQGGDSIKLHSD